MARRREEMLDEEEERLIEEGGAPEGFRRQGSERLPLGRKARETRNRLLAAAYEEFNRSGYRGTKANDIAARAGTSIGTFYQYFDSRADVMSALVHDSIRHTLSKPPWTWDEGVDGLRRMLHDYVATYQATAPFQGVWEEATHVDDFPASVRRELSRRITGDIERVLTEARRDGTFVGDADPQQVARALTAMVDRYCYVTYVFDPPDEPVPVEDAVDTLLYVWMASLQLPDGDRGSKSAGRRSRPRKG